MTTTPTSGAADLRTAAQAVVDRWDTPLWKDVPATAEYIGRLRAALAAGQATAPQQEVPDECFPGEPKVAVPQGLIGAACFAIRNNRNGSKVLEQLRRYSVGDQSQPLAPQPSPTAQAEEAVALDHIAVIEDGELRYMTGRKAPAYDCELYAMPDGKRAPVLFTAPQTVAREPLDEARRMFDAGWKAAAMFCDREDVAADGIIGFGASPQFEAAFSAANGIKGGQHVVE